jgi:predicted HTH transcriptional regulator
VEWPTPERRKPIKDHRIITGTLFEMTDMAVAFILDKLEHWIGVRNEGAVAPSGYDIPRSVVLEAIVNGIAHRDYTSNASVQVMLFRDRLEIWNPGRLPDGFTIQKLHEVHRSEPTNPVLAHPLFMAGYIEHLGTGTTDMIADCEALGLRTPEFIQADDFRTIIYRQEKVTEQPQKVSNPTKKVTEQGQKSNQAEQKVSDHGQKSNQADSKSNQAEPQSNQVRLTAKQRKVLDFCDETPRTAQEILEMLGVQN